MDLETLKQLRSTGEFSDLIVHVCGREFRLHKFPMLSCSDYFKGLLRSGMSDSANVSLNDLPGGESTMELVADFCYQLPVVDRLTVENIGHVMCASNYLQMKSLTAACSSKLPQLSALGISNCLRIMSSCCDAATTAEALGITRHCVETLVKHWVNCLWIDHERASSRPLFMPRPKYKCRGHEHTKSKQTVARWVSEMQTLPVTWVALVIKTLSAEPSSWQELPTELTDQFLVDHSSRDAMSVSEFVLLLKASASSPRETFDSVFLALENMIARKREDENCLSDGDIIDMIQQIDFTKLSQEALERALTNENIPARVVTTVAVTVSSHLRSQLREKDKVVNELQGQLGEKISEISQLQVRLEERKRKKSSSDSSSESD